MARENIPTNVEEMHRAVRGPGLNLVREGQLICDGPNASQEMKKLVESRVYTYVKDFGKKVNFLVVSAQQIALLRHLDHSVLGTNFSLPKYRGMTVVVR